MRPLVLSNMHKLRCNLCLFCVSFVQGCRRGWSWLGGYPMPDSDCFWCYLERDVFILGKTGEEGTEEMCDVERTWIFLCHSQATDFEIECGKRLLSLPQPEGIWYFLPHNTKFHGISCILSCPSVKNLATLSRDIVWMPLEGDHQSLSGARMPRIHPDGDPLLNLAALSKDRSTVN